MKIMPFKNAMKKAGMRLVYGGRHAVYKKTVEGKTLIMPVPAHPGTLILATYIKSLNDLFQFDVKTLLSLDARLWEIEKPSTSSESTVVDASSTNLNPQKIREKAKTQQQRTRKKDEYQVSGSKQEDKFSIKQSGTPKKDRVNSKSEYESSLVTQATPSKERDIRDDKKDSNAINKPSDQAPQQNNSELQDNSDTFNQGNKPKTTSQRGPPTDKESLQSKDISIKSDDKITEKSSKASASFNASKQSQKSPTTISQQTKTKSINKSEEQSKTLENKDPESSFVWFD
jgi:hypothetical protein